MNHPLSIGERVWYIQQWGGRSRGPVHGTITAVFDPEGTLGGGYHVDAHFAPRFRVFRTEAECKRQMVLEALQVTP